MSIEQPAEAGHDSSHDPSHDGAQLERLSFFSDAVFAIAMTLLVIEVRLPPLPAADDRALGQALLDLLPHYVGFLASFVVIGRFWVGHHGLFGYLRRTSQRLLWVNLLFLLAIAFMPFPTAVISEYLHLRVGVGFYTAHLIAVGLANVALTRTAFAGGTLLKPGAPDTLRAYRLRSSLVPVILGALGFVAGMIQPYWTLPVLILGSPLLNALLRRGPPPAFNQG